MPQGAAGGRLFICEPPGPARGTAYKMRILGPVSLVDVLAEWGFHECRGRLLKQLPREILQALDGPEGKRVALEVILHVRAPVVAAILVAEPLESMRIEL